ncbi:hypothetical protein DFH08DRAFT_817908 [Mycena albidolilacea]|uniref:Uncharacterized protein n=1 Tax=Mycena albidolilacea TaxID=1033008 RepID=A0AAD6ZHL9_9AGAR|nr:hypothetical protein DFH08DRAFT_817908 [Mycena albidolilacea]
MSGNKFRKNENRNPGHSRIPISQRLSAKSDLLFGCDTLVIPGFIAVYTATSSQLRGRKAGYCGKGRVERGGYGVAVVLRPDAIRKKSWAHSWPLPEELCTTTVVFRSIRIVTCHTAKNLRKFSSNSLKGTGYGRFNSYDSVTPQTVLQIEQNTTRENPALKKDDGDSVKSSLATQRKNDFVHQFLISLSCTIGHRRKNIDSTELMRNNKQSKWYYSGTWTSSAPRFETPIVAVRVDDSGRFSPRF